MRLKLVGYTGVRPPVPGTTGDTGGGGGDPTTDPDFVPPDPLTVVLNDGDIFHKLDYLALGYNRFEVVCIGGGGGRAGDLHETIPSSAAGRDDGTGPDINYNAYRYRNGGPGGGGGLHRIKGRLALLPSACPVVVGHAGADGADQIITSAFHDWRSGAYPAPPATPNGEDGGATTFGNTVCQASGGKGGSGQTGGHGGIGASVIPGGGAVAAAIGSWDGAIGSGGGGGFSYGIDALGSNWSTVGGGVHPGGKGNYSVSDPDFSAPGAIALPFSFNYDQIAFEMSGGALTGNRYIISGNVASVANAIAGVGGGAKTFPLDGSLAEWGTGGVQGFCLIRLTYLTL